MFQARRRRETSPASASSADAAGAGTGFVFHSTIIEILFAIDTNGVSSQYEL